MITGEESAYGGPCGAAFKIAIPDQPDAAETVAMWLIDAPGQSIAWSQYLLVCVRLRDNVPGFTPPKRKFEGATHEVLLMAVDPDTKLSPSRIDEFFANGNSLVPHTLRPLNFADQFEATDDEMDRVVGLCAWAVTTGDLPAEPPLSGGGQIPWLTAITKTLAHFRGEAHAS